MKKFKDIKIGDRLYVATIKDSVIQKDCVGGIIVDYHVEAVFDNKQSDRIGITFQKMRYQYKVGYVKEDRIEAGLMEETRYFLKDAFISVLPILESENNEFGLQVNKKIISPTKTALVEALDNSISDNAEKIKKMSSAASIAKARNDGMRLLLSLSASKIEFEKEEEVKELTEEEFACMALT